LLFVRETELFAWFDVALELRSAVDDRDVVAAGDVDQRVLRRARQYFSLHDPIRLGFANDQVALARGRIDDSTRILGRNVTLWDFAPM
jgi:hypothetical protein